MKKDVIRKELNMLNKYEKVGGGGNRLTASATRVSAFTMAEILLSLTIIGVVAAITLPSLTGNVNERVWNTQRKALHARFSQAVALMPSLNGYGTYSQSTSGGSTVTTDTVAEAFLTDGLSKVIKINNICDNEHLSDCGIPSNYTTLAGSTSAWPTTMNELNYVFNGEGPISDGNTKAAAFETQNGESIAVYYYHNCTPDMQEDASTYVSRYVYVQPKICANFIYDLNGNKGPNAVGKDIGFMTAIYSSDPVLVAPVPLANLATGTNGSNVAQADSSAACTAMDSESRVPNKEEAISLFLNKYLMGNGGGSYWTSKILTPTTAVSLDFDMGRFTSSDRSLTFKTRCIKR